jgi:hypothetical protein
MQAAPVSGQASMRLDIEVPREVVRGEPVPIVLRLTNTGDAADLVLQGRPVAFDVIVTRPDGAPIWRRLEGQVFPAILQLWRLESGERLEWRESWTQTTNAGQPVAPAEYLVTGILPTDPPAEMRTAPRELRILP